jgi:hypothetical protein
MPMKVTAALTTRVVSAEGGGFRRAVDAIRTRGMHRFRQRAVPGRLITELAVLTWALVLALTAAALAQPTTSPLPPRELPALQQSAPAKPRTAMVIVVEENQSETTSVTWARLGEALLTMNWEDLAPPEVLDAVRPVINAARPVAEALGLPLARLVDDISRAARREAFKMMGTVMGQAAGQLPGASCAQGLFNTLASQGLEHGKDPFSVFKDHGEEQLGNCLRQMAVPYYDRVVLLTDTRATFANFKQELQSLTRDGYLIDVLLDLHGCGQRSGANSAVNNGGCRQPPSLKFTGGAVRAEDVRGLQSLMLPSLPKAVDVPVQRPAGLQAVQPVTLQLRPRLNAVYSTACWSSEFNPQWLEAGARAANGPRELNYYVLLSPVVFLDQFTRGGKSLADAARAGYDAEKILLTGRLYTATLDLRPILASLFPPPAPPGVDLIGLACPGGTRAGCRWQFTLGPAYGGLVNTLFAKKYGHDKARPVNTAASSQRIQMGDAGARRAGAQ